MITRVLQLMTVLLIFGASAELMAQKKPVWKNRKKKKKTEAPVAPKPKPKKGAIQPYNKVVTKDAKTDDGLFKVHQIDTKYLYEIPDTLLEREMLMVTRIAKTASGIGFGGGKTTVDADDMEPVDTKYSTWGIRVTPGAQFWFNSNWSMLASIGQLGYSSRTNNVGETLPDGTSLETTTNDFGLNIDFDTFNLAFFWHF